MAASPPAASISGALRRHLFADVSPAASRPAVAPGDDWSGAIRRGGTRFLAASRPRSTVSATRAASTTAITRRTPTGRCSRTISSTSPTSSISHLAFVTPRQEEVCGDLHQRQCRLRCHPDSVARDSRPTRRCWRRRAALQLVSSVSPVRAIPPPNSTMSRSTTAAARTNLPALQSCRTSRSTT
jgi:hypothetical protein